MSQPSVRSLAVLGFTTAFGFTSSAFGQAPATCLGTLSDQLSEGETLDAASARAVADADAGNMVAAAARARAVILSSQRASDVSKATEAYVRAMGSLIGDSTREPACLVQIATDTHRFGAERCAGPGAADAKSCRRFDRVGSDALRMLADKAVSKPDDDPARDRVRMREAGRLYLDAFERIRGACGKDRESADCNRPDELLYGASVAFAGGRDLQRSMEARDLLLDLPAGLATPGLVAKAAFEGGMILFAIADFSGALKYFERASALVPKERQGKDALANVILLRMAHGDSDAALEAANKYLKLYGSSADTVSVDVAVGEHLAERGRHAEAVKWLEGAMKRIGRVSSAKDELVWAQATFARSLAALGRKDKAEQAWRSVLGLTQALPSSVPDASAFQALGRNLTARGEAIIELTRPLVSAAMRMKLKKGDIAGLKEKRAKVEEAEVKLAQIFQISPVPPPGPTVEAAALAARMRRQLWAETHLVFGADSADPFLQTAKAANRRCADLSAKFQHTSPGARRCSVWLAERFPDDHARLSELVPPLLVAPSTLPRPQPIPEP